MFINVLKRVSIEVLSILCVVPVDYDEEDMPNDFPGREEDQWSVIIDLHDGALKLTDGTPFPKDVTLELHMKVRDSGEYSLRGHSDEVTVTRQAGVPSFFPGQHYGDYLIFDIADGKIENWNMPCADDVAEAFGDED